MTLPHRRHKNSEKKYMASFRGTACEACGQNDGTVVAAHCNMERGGTGYRALGIVAGLCMRCHDLADGRTNDTKVERMKVWIRVAQKLMGERFEAWR